MECPDNEGPNLGSEKSKFPAYYRGPVKTGAHKYYYLRKLTDKIGELCGSLPNTVPVGGKEDKIYHVLTKVQGLDADSVGSTFNRRFDILFKEDRQCRDDNGRFRFVTRGGLGMRMVVN
ncbi:hypothetical protein FB45DRAFT_1042923 [Roridomyces roridus]|uniref:Uncharacterized protein n=1 Tax=Roridomyces roridus TaxID=1738132 RepID=A0AAD7AZ20_9AGAR|nr:hypothetical protein FB45DRAFT_1042923 [Roridomyces roridus]